MIWLAATPPAIETISKTVAARKATFLNTDVNLHRVERSVLLVMVTARLSCCEACTAIPIKVVHRVTTANGFRSEASGASDQSSVI